MKWLVLKRGKYAETIAMTSWLIATTFLTLCYLSVLLSNLTKMEYEKPVDFIQDVLDNDYKFLVPGGTHILEALKKDPRPKIKIAMQKRLVVFPFRGVRPPWVTDMRVSLLQLHGLSVLVWHDRMYLEYQYVNNSPNFMKSLSDLCKLHPSLVSQRSD